MTTDSLRPATRVKICGITSVEDARVCIACGADALGFMFAESPRRVTPEQARDIIRECGPFVTTVGVFVNAPVEEVKRILDMTGCGLAQLHGDESPEYLEVLSPARAIKAIRVRDQLGEGAVSKYAAARALLLDTFVAGKPGGTGRRFDTALAAELVAAGWRVIVAGGLTPGNVGEVVTAVRPYGVDVGSGVEFAPGRKDHEKVARFIAAVRAADGRVQ
jgi:phosphoribosylanthranilate isomerase